MPAPVVDSVLDLVGETPVVRLRNLSPAGGATIWGKCEHLNPGGSVKDRICLAMIEAAEAEGRLRQGDGPPATARSPRPSAPVRRGGP